MILSHETQNPLASDLVPLDEAESAPDLAMPFTGKRRGLQIVPDEGKQFVIRKKRLWPAFSRCRRRDALQTCLAGVEGGTGNVPYLADPLNAIGLACGQGDIVALIVSTSPWLKGTSS